MTAIQEQVLHDYLGRHLVGIGGVYVELDAAGNPIGPQRGVGFSGFVVELGGWWYVVTAGHILGARRGFSDLITNKRIKVSDCKFVDSIGIDAKHPYPTPFSWEDTEKFHICNDGLGLDIGVFKLKELHILGLKSNGVMALSEQNWLNGDADGAQDFLVLGFPTEEKRSEETGGVVQEYIRPCIAGITPCPKPDYVPATTNPRFFGTLNSDEPTDMDGFSGGPIFRFNDQSGQYWLHAVQSAWYEQHRLTIGCPMGLVAQAIRNQWKTP